MRRLSLLISDTSGGAAVEFGLIAPFMIAVVLGVTASVGLIHDYHVMRQAVSSGAQLLMATDADVNAARDVTLGAWSGKVEGATVAVSQWCGCGGVQHACSTACSDGDYPQMFTRIDASTPYTGPLGQQTMTTSQTVRTR